MSNPNQYSLCEDAPTFMKALECDLQEARSRVFAQFMTFEGDASGEGFAELLIQKAADGLDVRLVIDHYVDVIADDILPTRIHRRRALRAEQARTAALFARLECHGVKVQRTAPPGTLLRYILFRNHKKLVVVDDEVAFVGGMNVSDHNFSWNDFMVRVCGPLADDIARDFLGTWNGQSVQLSTPRTDGDYVLNSSAGKPAIAARIQQMIDTAAHSVVIESPSLLGDALEQSLVEARARGVRVQVILPARHNRWIFRVWARATIDRLVRSGISVHAYRGKDDMTHAKLVIVDDAHATFGSFNLFELESLTQQELNVFTQDEDLIGELRRIIERDLSRSTPVRRPRTTFGRFSYVWLVRGITWWTRRLLQDPEWRRLYC